MATEWFSILFFVDALCPQYICKHLDERMVSHSFDKPYKVYLNPREYSQSVNKPITLHLNIQLYSLESVRKTANAR